MTPHVLVDAQVSGVEVPQQYVQEGQIALNISPTAIRDLLINNESLSFNARFAGTPYQIYVPVRAVLAIYAKETGNGMVFPEEVEDLEETDESQETVRSDKKPHLTVVK